MVGLTPLAIVVLSTKFAVVWKMGRLCQPYWKWFNSRGKLEEKKWSCFSKEFEKKEDVIKKK